MLYRHCRVLLLSMLCSLLACVPAHAGDDSGTDPALVIERLMRHYVVEPGGGYVLTVEDVRTIAERSAIQVHGQYGIAYNRGLDEVLAVEAYTLKADGRRVPVDAEQIKDQPEPVSANAPVFQDARARVVVFPEVAVGDRLVVRYTIRRATPLFPGHFEDLVMPQFYRHRDFQLIYDMPASLPLHADAVGFSPVPVDSPPGRKRYQWRYVDGGNPRIELDSVSYVDYGRRLAVSTFADYAAFAAAFRQGAAGKSQASPAITALARQLVAGLPDARARAVALSDWVGRNVRYVGDYVGAGGVVPHAAANVLANRYGDCKDHAMLLEALLAAAGIDSTPALVNDGNAYKLPDAPTLGVFNHMITWIPSLDLYLDPTAQAEGSGYLPAVLLGKPVLLLKTGSFAMTPVLQPRRVVTAATVDVGRDGHASYRVSRMVSGALAEPLRTTDGSGDEFTGLPRPSALSTTHEAWSAVGGAVAAMTQEKDRRQDYVCQAIDTEDETDFRLPRGIRILALPAAANVVDGGLFYTASYVRQQTRQGSAIIVKRRLTFRHGTPTCAPADYRALRPALERIQRDLRSQIVVAGK